MYRQSRNRENGYERRAYEALKDDLLAEMEARQNWEEATRYRRPGLMGRIRGENNYDRNLARLRGDLGRELRAIQAIENRVGRTRDPLVRELLTELLDEAHEQGTTVGHLAGLYNGGGLKDRLTSFLGGGTGAMAWLLPALLLFLATPKGREGLRPLAKKVVEGAMDVSDKFNEIFTTAKEEVEDIVAEVNFEKIKNALTVSEDTPPPQ